MDAIRYATSRWTGLTPFLEDGRVEMDSNTAEPTIGSIALNRKNALGLRPMELRIGNRSVWSVGERLVE